MLDIFLFVCNIIIAKGGVNIKIFLFLYPINEYFNHCIKESQRIFERNGYDIKRISEIIETRYRKNEYVIYWLMFCSKNNKDKPDLSRIAENIITIAKDDKIIQSDISFENHINKKIYPNPAFIFSQIPENIKHLVLGGFHQGDCVEKLAEYAYAKGIDVFVDEDTTELFFARTSLIGQLSLAQKKISLEQLGIKGSMLEIAKRQRKNKPWLI